MTHSNTPPKIPLHKRRLPTNSDVRFHAPRRPAINEATLQIANTNWLDQLTGHPAQTYTVCCLDNQLHILYLHYRKSYWQGYLVSSLPFREVVPNPGLGVGHSLCIDHLLTDPAAVWSPDHLARLHITLPNLNQARSALIRAFITANDIPFNRIIRFTRPRA